MSLIEKQHQAEQTEGSPPRENDQLTRFMLVSSVVLLLIVVYCLFASSGG